MSYAQENGYTPTDFATLMGLMREAVNTQFGTSFDEGTFVGTNWYKFLYVPVQEILKNETKTAEIFLKLQEYIATTNARIQRPSISLPGIVDSFEANGYVASVRKNAASDAGKVAVCVDTDDAADDYAEKRLEICNFLKDFIAAGMVFEGTEEESITLTNGQEFDFKFYLPDPTPIVLKLTLTSSDNQELVVPDDEEIRQTVFDNINERYRLGWDFEPQRYYTQVDAPWAATILLQYSTNIATPSWASAVFEADFRDLFTFELDDITVLVDP
jgi:hypothetical protein